MLNVFVWPEVSGNVTVVIVGAAMMPFHVVLALVTTVDAGIATVALLAFAEVIVIAGMVPVPPAINELTSIVGLSVPSLMVILTACVGLVITTFGVVELTAAFPDPSGIVWSAFNMEKEDTDSVLEAFAPSMTFTEQFE